MSVLRQYIQFLKEYNKLLDRGTKNIYDNSNFIWVNQINELVQNEDSSSFVNRLFKEDMAKESLVFTLKKPLKPRVSIPHSYLDSITFDDAKNKFEGSSDELLNEFLQLPEAKLELEKINHFKTTKGIYSKLFKAFNDTKSDSNEEIVLSVGLIQYSKQSERKEKAHTVKINQHLFHFPLKIDLLNDNTIKVYFSDDEKPYADPFFLNNTPVQKDVLDNIIDKFEAEIDVQGYGFLFDRNFQNLLSNNLQQISSNSVFLGLNIKPASDESKLDTFEINFSPAINFKTRKPRFFEKLTESIIKFDEENDPEVPLLNLILRNPDTTHTNNFIKPNYFADTLYQEFKNENEHLAENDFSIFFPLPFNKEQKEILDKYQENRLTVVTGPPGTGKSHSIVNILCSLLAQGKKVLVTAQSDKALESLLDKVPKQFDNLIFTKIKLPNSTRFSLENSIDGISTILTSKRDFDIKEKIGHLNSFKANYVKYKDEINTILANEYKSFNLNDSFKDLKNYQIYEKFVAKEPEEWNWINDEISGDLLQNFAEVEKSIKQYKTILDNKDLEINSTFDVGLFLKEFKVFAFDQYFSLQKNISEIKGQIGINTYDPEQLLKIDIDSVKSLMRKYDNSDVILQNIQAVNKLTRKYNLIPEELEDLISNLKFDELSNGSSKLLNDIQLYLALIPNEKNEVPYFRKKFNSKFRDVKYLEEVTINDQFCNNKLLVQKLRIYVEKIFDIQNKIREIKISGFEIDDTKTYAINEKIKQYNRGVQLIIKNYDVLELLENNLIIKAFSNLFSVQQYDLRSLYGKANQYSEEVRLLQNLELRLISENQTLHELSTRLQESDLAKYFLRYFPFMEIKTQSSFIEIEKLLEEIHAKVEIKSSFQKAESYLKKFLPNTLVSLNQVPEKFIKKENFEYYMAAKHLKEISLFDIQAIKDKLKYYFDEIIKTKSEILFDLAKANFQKTFKNEGIHDFINLLNNFKYNVSQGNRGIQNSTKFQNLARKNSVLISQRLSCWVMKFNDVLNSLGNDPEIFDCIIVDEASQLDFNSLLLSYYAKNMIIVGDDKQTSPSGLSGVSQEDLSIVRDRNLDFLGDERIHIRNDNSLFSLAKIVAGTANLSLKEHFRCVPEIIAFSKEKFYNSTLRPLKQLNSNRLRPKLSLFVKDAFLENRIVLKEIEQIRNYIGLLLSDSEYKDKSIGIVSLGSADHTTRLESILEDPNDSFTRELIEKHNLIISDASKFQGDERDVMLVSLGVALDYTKQLAKEEAKPTRIINNELNLTDSLKSINVAMSRAKEQMILFHSISADQLKPGDFRIEIINFFNEKYVSIPEFKIPGNVSKTSRTRENVPQPFDSWFEYDIVDALMDKGYKFIKPQYEVKEKELWDNPRTGKQAYVSFKLDIVVFVNGKSVAIECDGDPFHSKIDDVAYDVERQEFLERVGWKIYRILYSTYRKQPNLEIDNLIQFISRNTD